MDIIERNETVLMATANLASAPVYDFPAGYGVRWYVPGDEAAWVAVQSAADRFIKISHELFVKEFGQDATVLSERVGFLVNPAGEDIGTCTAWIDAEFENRTAGRVHWVAIVPGEQGKGLAKPMLSAICQQLLKLGQTTAYLVTSTARIPAINLYRSFGFEPVITNDEQRQIWREVGPHLKAALNV